MYNNNNSNKWKIYKILINYNYLHNFLINKFNKISFNVKILNIYLTRIRLF